MSRIFIIPNRAGRDKSHFFTNKFFKFVIIADCSLKMHTYYRVAININSIIIAVGIIRITIFIHRESRDRT